MSGILQGLHVATLGYLISYVADAVCNNFNAVLEMQGVGSAMGTSISFQRLKSKISQVGVDMVKKKQKLLIRSIEEWRQMSDADKASLREATLLIRDIAQNMMAVGTAAINSTLPHSTLQCKEIVVNILKQSLSAVSSLAIHLPIRRIMQYIQNLQEVRQAQLKEAREQRVARAHRWGIVEPSVLARV